MSGPFEKSSFAGEEKSLPAQQYLRMARPPATNDSAGEPADAELLSRAQHGDETAFREIVARHGRYLFGVARALVQNAHDAEDAVQETLAAAVSAGYRGESAVRTWLVAILVRQAALLKRKRSRWWRRPERQDPAETLGSFEQAIDARLDLAAMLGRLSDEHREVIVLRELEGMTYEQIAAVLHLPRGTVESRLYRAREQLKELFAAKETPERRRRDERPR